MVTIAYWQMSHEFAEAKFWNLQLRRLVCLWRVGSRNFCFVSMHGFWFTKSTWVLQLFGFVLLKLLSRRNRDDFQITLFSLICLGDRFRWSKYVKVIWTSILSGSYPVVVSTSDGAEIAQVWIFSISLYCPIFLFPFLFLKVCSFLIWWTLLN